METQSPASTNGESAFNFAETDPTIQIFTPSHANLIGYVGENQNFETVTLELNLRTSLLTHPSATAAYAVFKQDCVMLGIPPAPFNQWLKAAVATSRLQHDRLKEEGIIEQNLSSTVSL
jgi:hypothetical protein